MRYILPAFLAIVVSTIVLADGKGFSTRGGVDVATADQRAIICFSGQRQTLVVETGLRGDGDEFAWVIPVPADPVVAPATRGALTTIDRLTSPRLDASGDPWFIAVVVVALTVSLAILGHYRAVLYICLAGVLFMCLIGVLLPTARSARAGASASDEGAVRLHSRHPVGAYDVAVIRGDRGDTLLDWLHREGFHVPPGIDTAVDDYARRGWRFVVARLRPDTHARGQTLQPHPLAMRFATAQPIYPMRLTGVGQRESITLDLFVFADGRARAAGLDAWCAADVQRPPLDEHARPWPLRNGVTVRHPYLRSIVAHDMAITRLRGQLTPRQMEQDILLRLSPMRPTWRTLYTPAAAADRALTIASAVLGCGMIAAAFAARTRTPRLRLPRFILGLGGIAAISVGVVSYVTLPRATVRDHWFSRNTAAMQAGEWIEQRLAGTPVPTRADVEVACQAVRSEVFGADAPPMLDEDSPGNLTVREGRNGVEVIGFDAEGAGFVVWPTTRERKPVDDGPPLFTP